MSKIDFFSKLFWICFFFLWTHIYLCFSYKIGCDIFLDFRSLSFGSRINKLLDYSGRTNTSVKRHLDHLVVNINGVEYFNISKFEDYLLKKERIMRKNKNTFLSAFDKEILDRISISNTPRVVYTAVSDKILLLGGMTLLAIVSTIISWSRITA